MGQVLIRNLPDDVIEVHRRRAIALGHSLEQELRTPIEVAATYSAGEKVAVAEWSQSLTPPGLQADAAVLIREDRDRSSVKRAIHPPTRIPPTTLRHCAQRSNLDLGWASAA
jgi:plasmid stability protein